MGPRWPLGNLFSPEQFSIKIFRRTSKPVGGGTEGGGGSLYGEGREGGWGLGPEKGPHLVNRMTETHD